MAASASAGEPPAGPLSAGALRQIAHATLALMAMLVLARIDYRALRPFGLPLYGVSLAALAGVLLIGVSEFGARRWIGSGGLTLQPAELAKPALMLGVAAFLSARRPGSVAALLGALAMLAAPLALVALEPDTGSGLVVLGGWLGLIVAWGAPWRTLGALAVVILALVPLTFAVAVPGYQRERIAVFLDPARDPLGSGFDLQRAELALRSGGLGGRGLFADGSALEGVSTRSSDFVFAFAAEGLGLAGVALLLGLLALAVWRGLRAALVAPDAFGRLLAAGMSMTLFTQAFLHVASNLRLFPGTGLPLPFVSQGGSSLLAMGIAAGLLLSIGAHRPASAREQWRAERWR